MFVKQYWRCSQQIGIYHDSPKHVKRWALKGNHILYIFKGNMENRVTRDIGEHEANINIQNWVSSVSSPAQFNQITLLSPLWPEYSQSKYIQGPKSHEPIHQMLCLSISPAESPWCEMQFCESRRATAAWHKINGRSSNKILRVYLHTQAVSSVLRKFAATHTCLQHVRTNSPQDSGLTKSGEQRAERLVAMATCSHHICPHLGAHDYVP